MKKLFSPILFLALCCLAACEEKTLIIPDLQVGKRHVLAEELTGVRCNNCPEGAADLVALQNQYGKENFIVVSIHAAAGSLSQPYTDAPSNQYDFRSAEATALYNFIGTAEGVPTASISRISPQGTTWLDRPWAGFIQSEFAKDYGLSIAIENTFNAATRDLEIAVTLLPGSTLSGENRLTVLITQDSIVDTQLVGPVRVENYVHRHVLRDVVTSPTGETLTEALIGGGAPVVKKFNVTLPADFVEKNCYVVAFVHHGGIPDKEVLQVTEKHVVE